MHLKVESQRDEAQAFLVHMMSSAAKKHEVSSHLKLASHLVEEGMQRFVVARSGCPSLARDAGLHLGPLHSCAGAHQAHVGQALLQCNPSMLGRSVHWCMAIGGVQCISRVLW